MKRKFVLSKLLIYCKKNKIRTALAAYIVRIYGKTCIFLMGFELILQREIKEKKYERNQFSYLKLKRDLWFC